MIRLSKADVNYLGPARVRLLDRLLHLGHVLIDPARMDAFSQMSVRECSQYVRGMEEFLLSLEHDQYAGKKKVVVRFA